MILENENFKLALNSALHKTDVSGGVFINADCLEIMDKIPNDSIDCFVSDVPYKLVQGGVTGKLSAKITGVDFVLKEKNKNEQRRFYNIRSISAFKRRT
jgi:DNA modification methylase